LAGDQAPTQFTAAGRAATGGCDDDSATAPACGPPPRWQLRRRSGPPASHPQRRRVDRSSWEEDGVVDDDVVRGHGRRDAPVGVTQSRRGEPKGPRPTASSDMPRILSHLPASNVPKPPPRARTESILRGCGNQSLGILPPCPDSRCACHRERQRSDPPHPQRASNGGS